MRTITIPLPSETLTEVFSTNQGAVYQSDAENCVYLQFAGKTSRYKFACLERLKKGIDKIDLEKMTDVSHPGIEIIFLCGAEDCFVLDVKEILDLRELLAGTFAMYQLNHILKDCLHRLVI